MGLSLTTIEQREKEAEALRYFLIYSLIGSLLLHIGLIAFGLSKFLLGVAAKKEQPIEVAIMEIPTQEVTEPLPEKKLSTNTNPGGGGGGGGGSNNGGGINFTQVEIPQEVRIPSIAPVVRQYQPKIAPEPAAKQYQQYTAHKPVVRDWQPQPPNIKKIEVTDNSPIPAREEAQPAKNFINEAISKLNREPDSNTRPSDNHNPTSVTPTSQPVSTSASVPTSSTQLSKPLIPLGRGFFGGLGNPFKRGSGGGIGNGSGGGIGNGSGGGIGNGSGNEVKKEPPDDSKLATAPKPRTENNVRLNPADCVSCSIKYPKNATRKRLEGNPEVIIDYDENGRVTNRRLSRSSGSRELDEALLEQARNFQLKPTPGGKQGVRVLGNFAIDGSQRHRELQERKRKKETQQRRREAEQKQPEADTTASTPIESPKPSQRVTTPVINDVPSENRSRRRQESRPSSQPTPPQKPTVAPQQPVESNTQTQPQSNRSEEVQKNRSNLREILRRQHSSESSPPEAPEPASTEPVDAN